MDYLLNGLPYFPGTTIFGTGLFADGTAAAPSISFAADSDTGFYRSSGGLVGVASNGARGLLFGAGVIYGQANFNSITMDAAGAIALAAAGTNQNITLTPSGTGQVQITNVAVGTALASATYGKVIIAGPPVSTVPTLFLTNLNDASLVFDFPSAFVGRLRTNAGSENLAFGISTTEHGRLNTAGRWLFGTTTDSGALVQIGNNTTTAAGGMVFGTDQFLYRASNSQMRLIGPTTNVGFWIQQSDAATGIFISCTSGVAGLQTTAAGQSLELKSGAQVTALTLDSSQNSTFAGWIKPRLATTAGAPAYVKGAIYFDTTLNKLRVGGATAWETITSA